MQYADFARLAARAGCRARCWSAARLLARAAGGAPPVLELPTDRPRPAVQSYRGAALSPRLPAPLTAGLRRSRPARGGDAVHDPAGGLPGAAGPLQRARRTSASARRSRAATGVEIEGLIGFFVNTLVLRTDLSGDPTLPGAAGAGAGGGAGGLRASGPAVREAGGGAAAGAEPEPLAAVPGDVRAAERRRRTLPLARDSRLQRAGASRPAAAKFDLTART